MIQKSQLGAHLDADQLSMFVDGKAAPHEREQILAHLSRCPDCRRVVFLMQSQEPELSSTGAENKRQPWRRWITPVSLAGAALACSLMLAAYLWTHRSEQIARQNTPTQPSARPQAEAPAPGSVGPSPENETRKDQSAANAKAPEVAEHQKPSAPKPPQNSLIESQPAGMSASRNPLSPLSQADALQDRKTEGLNAPTPLAKEATPATPGELAQIPFTDKNPEKQRGFVAAQSLPQLRIEHNRGPEDGNSEVAGRVTDPSGAVVAGASISLRDAGGKTQQTSTSADGSFKLAGVPPGHYELQVTAPGFESSRQAMDLQSRDMALLDSVLKVGASAETVEVQSTSPVLNTESASVSLSQVVAPLPSHLSVVTTARLGNHVLSLDSVGVLFASRNGGKRWKRVKPQWTGTIARIESIEAGEDEALGERKKKRADADNGLGKFKLTTSSGDVWISSDGVHWQAQ